MTNPISPDEAIALWRSRAGDTSVGPTSDQLNLVGRALWVRFGAEPVTCPDTFDTIWDDNVGDSGVQTTDQEIRDFADAVRAAANIGQPHTYDVMTNTDQPRAVNGEFDSKTQSAPDASVALSETPLATYTVEFSITGKHVETVEATSLDEAIEKASNQANEHSEDVAYELNVIGTSVE